MKPIKWIANPFLAQVVLALTSLLCVVSCAGRTFEKEGYSVVRNRLRLGPRPMPYPMSNGVFRIAAEKGRLSADLVIANFDVTSGEIVFHGSNGVIRLLENKKLEVRKDGYETWVFAIRYPVISMDLVGGKRTEPRMNFQYALAPTAEERAFREKMRDIGIWESSPSLIASESNGFYLITIPYSVSSDFQGNIGKATLESNWYDF